MSDLLNHGHVNHEKTTMQNLIAEFKQIVSDQDIKYKTTFEHIDTLLDGFDRQLQSTKEELRLSSRENRELLKEFVGQVKLLLDNKIDNLSAHISELKSRQDYTSEKIVEHELLLTEGKKEHEEYQAQIKSIADRVHSIEEELQKPNKNARARLAVLYTLLGSGMVTGALGLIFGWFEKKGTP